MVLSWFNKPEHIELSLGIFRFYPFCRFNIIIDTLVMQNTPNVVENYWLSFNSVSTIRILLNRIAIKRDTGPRDKLAVALDPTEVFGKLPVRTILEHDTGRTTISSLKEPHDKLLFQSTFINNRTKASHIVYHRNMQLVCNKRSIHIRFRRICQNNGRAVFLKQTPIVHH